MRSTVVLFLAAAAIAFGTVWAIQSHKAAVQRDQLASVQAELSEKAKQIETLQAAQKRSKQQRRELMAQTDDLAAQVQALQAAQTNTAATASPNANGPPVSAGEQSPGNQSGIGNIFSKMMGDPDTRQLVRATQRIMVDQLYAPLIGKLGLTPDEAGQFKDLLADNMMDAADRASSLFGGSASTNRSGALAELTNGQKAFDEQVRTFLGDDRYAQYQEYQQTAAERMQLNAFKLQAGGDFALNDQQTEALISIMKEEQKNVAASTGLPLGGSNPDPAKLQALMSEDKMGRMIEAQQTIGQQVFERARTVLSAEQLVAFGQFQTNQLQMMRLGMSMMRKMFTPDQGAVATGSPGQ